MSEKWRYPSSVVITFMVILNKIFDIDYNHIIGINLWCAGGKAGRYTVNIYLVI